MPLYSDEPSDTEQVASLEPTDPTREDGAPGIETPARGSFALPPSPPIKHEQLIPELISQLESHVACKSTEDQPSATTPLLTELIQELLDTHLRESCKLLQQASAKIGQVDTLSILEALERDSLKTQLCTTVIPIVKMDDFNKYLIGT